MAMCIATYEATGSQVQMALERGLPAMLGNFATKQLPYPSLSFDMVHCAQCDISWNDKGNLRKNSDVPYFILWVGDTCYESLRTRNKQDGHCDLQICKKSVLTNHKMLCAYAY